MVMLRNGDLLTLRRSDEAAGAVEGGAANETAGLGLSKLSAVPGETRRFVGIHQTTTVPPDLWLLDAKTGSKTSLTEINPELKEQTLGARGKDQMGGQQRGQELRLFNLPGGLPAGHALPLRDLMQDPGTTTFIHGGNGGMISNFAPQALANCGFVVLMLEDAVGPYAKGTWKGLPGGVSEALRAMDALRNGQAGAGSARADRSGAGRHHGLQPDELDRSILRSRTRRRLGPRPFLRTPASTTMAPIWATKICARAWRPCTAARPAEKRSRRGSITRRPFPPGACGRRCSCNITVRSPWPRSSIRP